MVLGAALCGTAIAINFEGMKEQTNEKDFLRTTLIQTIRENTVLMDNLGEQQDILKTKSEKEFITLGPYLKIDLLDKVYAMSQLTENCPSEAEELATPVASLRVWSYYNGALFYNLPDDHATIDAHRENLKISNKFLQDCLNKLGR